MFFERRVPWRSNRVSRGLLTTLLAGGCSTGFVGDLVVRPAGGDRVHDTAPTSVFVLIRRPCRYRGMNQPFFSFANNAVSHLLAT